MKQREINAAVVYLLRSIVNELRRGVPSHSWGRDMTELPEQLDRLERALGLVADDETDEVKEAT